MISKPNMLCMALLACMASAASHADQLVVTARASLADNGGALMQVGVNGTVIGTQEARSSSDQAYVFQTSTIGAGSRIDVVFTNDAESGGRIASCN